MKVEPELAKLAHMTNMGLNSNLNSQKDSDILGGSVDVRKFIPGYNNGRTGNTQHHHFPPTPDRRRFSPQPQTPRDTQFSPVSLPSSPETMIPMPKGSEVYIENVNYEFGPQQADPKFETPSFQNTDFLKPTPNIHRPVIESSPDNIFSVLEKQSNEIDSLKKLVKTLNRNINKLIKQIDEQNRSTEGIVCTELDRSSI